MTYRGSHLEAYDECAQKYRLSVSNDGVPAIYTSTEADRGTAVHAVIEKYLRGIRDGLTPRVAQAATSDVLDSLRGTISAEGIEQARSFLKGIFEQPFPERTERSVWLIETSFGFDSDWNLTASSPRFRGKMDFGYFETGSSAAFVRDFKTSLSAEPVSDLRWRPKNLSYVLAVRALMREAGAGDPETVTFQRHYTSLGRVQQFTLDRGMMDEIPRVLDARIAAIEGDAEFAPRPAPGRCLDCWHRHRCAAYTSSGIATLEVKDAAGAKKAAEALALMEARAKDLDRAVRSWIDRNGPIDLGGGRRLTMKPEDRRSVKDGIVDLLRHEVGLPDETILRYANVTVGALEKMLDDEDAVSRLVDVSVVTKMRVEKGR